MRALLAAIFIAVSLSACDTDLFGPVEKEPQQLGEYCGGLDCAPGLHCVTQHCSETPPGADDVPVPDVQCLPPPQAQADAAADSSLLGSWTGEVRFLDSRETREYWIGESRLQIDPFGKDSLRVSFQEFNLNFYCAADQGEWGSTRIDCDNYDSSPDYTPYRWSVELVFSTTAAVGSAYRTIPSFTGGGEVKGVKGTWCRYGMLTS